MQQWVTILDKWMLHDSSVPFKKMNNVDNNQNFACIMENLSMLHKNVQTRKDTRFEA
jgi:hypothetical protein